MLVYPPKELLPRARMGLIGIAIGMALLMVLMLLVPGLVGKILTPLFFTLTAASIIILFVLWKPIKKQEQVRYVAITEQGLVVASETTTDKIISKIEWQKLRGLGVVRITIFPGYKVFLLGYHLSTDSKAKRQPHMAFLGVGKTIHISKPMPERDITPEQYEQDIQTATMNPRALKQLLDWKLLK